MSGAGGDVAIWSTRLAGFMPLGCRVSLLVLALIAGISVPTWTVAQQRLTAISRSERAY